MDVSNKIKRISKWRLDEIWKIQGGDQNIPKTMDTLEDAQKAEFYHITTISYCS